MITRTARIATQTPMITLVVVPDLPLFPAWLGKSNEGENEFECENESENENECDAVNECEDENEIEEENFPVRFAGVNSIDSENNDDIVKHSELVKLNDFVKISELENESDVVNDSEEENKSDFVNDSELEKYVETVKLLEGGSGL